MSKRDSSKAKRGTDQAEQPPPPGVKLLHTLRGHKGVIGRVAWSPDGLIIASPAMDGTVLLWDFETGSALRTLKASQGSSYFSVAWSSDGRLLAATSENHVYLWDAESGELLSHISSKNRHRTTVAWSPAADILAVVDGYSVKFLGSRLEQIQETIDLERIGRPDILSWSPGGEILAIGTRDNAILLGFPSMDVLQVLNIGPEIYDIVWPRTLLGNLFAVGSTDDVISICNALSGRILRRLEGHTANIESLSFSSDGRLLASRANAPDNSVRIWRCDSWETVATIHEKASGGWPPGIAFHPHLPVLATLGERDSIIRIWHLDLGILLDRSAKPKGRSQAVHHTTAKVVLVGDSGVGKTGLGWRLAHGEFKEHSSTHGQQFWVLAQLGARRADGTECEAILWDLAGQPDYRLTHALFINDADLALVLFDPTDSRDPLHGVEFWLKQLKAGRTDGQSGHQAGSAGEQSLCPTILVGGRADRGEARLTQEELDAFCRERGISGGYLATSAKEGKGLNDLIRRMKDQVPWESKTATVTTVTFKRIKDYVLGLKENRRRRKVIVSPKELRQRLEKLSKRWRFTDDEMMTAVGHLANYGYVRVLRTSKGEDRILLVPEILNNLAASFVLEARRNPKGLGSLEESRLLGAVTSSASWKNFPKKNAAPCSTRRRCYSSSTMSASAKLTH